MRTWIAIAMLFMVGGVARGDGISSPDISLDVLPGQGMTIDLCGVPLSRGSTLQLFQPGWKKGYFSSTWNRPEMRVDPEKRQLEADFHAEKDVQFDVREAVRFVNDRRIEITLDGKLATHVPAKLEWGIAEINAFTLYGGGFIAGDAGKIVEVSATGASAEGSKDLAEANSVTLISPVGRAIVRMEHGDAKLTLLDGRRDANAPWAQEQPTLWLGFTGEDVTADQPFHYLVSIDFQPAAPPTTAPVRQVVVKCESVNDAIVPQSAPITIIPQPKKLSWKDGNFALEPKVKLRSSVPDARAGIGRLLWIPRPSSHFNRIRLCVRRSTALNARRSR